MSSLPHVSHISVNNIENVFLPIKVKYVSVNEQLHMMAGFRVHRNYTDIQSEKEQVEPCPHVNMLGFVCYEVQWRIREGEERRPGPPSPSQPSFFFFN